MTPGLGTRLLGVRRRSGALFASTPHYADTVYGDDSEHVFCHSETGGPLDRKRYANTLRVALAMAKVEGRVRPFQA